MNHNEYVPQDETLIQTKVPRSFAKALSRAAASRMVTRSAFIRMSLADCLKTDGIEAGAA